MNLGDENDQVEKIYDNFWALDGDTGILGYCNYPLRRRKENKYIRHVATEKYVLFVILNIFIFLYATIIRYYIDKF